MRRTKLAGGVAAMAVETLVVLALVVSGCGKPGAPPPGAARRLGTDVGKRHRNRPAGNAGRFPRLVPWRGSPQAEQGAPK